MNIKILPSLYIIFVYLKCKIATYKINISLFETNEKKVHLLLSMKF